jgi:transposase InsO family protein
MGMECIRIYDTFEWAPAVPAVAADLENNIAAQPARPAENKHNLDHVFAKFDQYWGVHRYRSIKRQEFLDTERKKNAKGELEPIMDFITELKRKAEYCEFGDKKDSLICDKVINGVKDKRCAERLLDIPDTEMCLAKVVLVCRQYELTQAHMKAMDPDGASKKQDTSVNMARGQPRGRSSNRRGSRSRGRGSYHGQYPYCERCTKHHSYNYRCPALDRQCDTCGQRGHYKVSPLCTARRSAPPNPTGNGYGQNRGTSSHRSRGRGNFQRGRGHPRVHYSHEEQGYQNEHYYDEQYQFNDEQFSQSFNNDLSINDVFVAQVDHVNKVNSNDWDVVFRVNDKLLKLEIDTGAKCNILSTDSLKNLGIEHVTKNSSTIIHGVHGKQVQSLGLVTLKCTYKEMSEYVDFEVLNGVKGLNLLGRHDCVRFGLVARVNHIGCSEIIESFKDVIGKEVGCMPGEYTIKIDPNVNPVVHPPRPVPAAIREQVKQELEMLEQKGILAKVNEPTAWVNSMVCARKKTGRVRICIDPSDLNHAVLREHFPMNSLEDIATRLENSKIFSTLDANMGYYQMRLSKESSDLTTFNTPFGRFKYLRMPMGIKCAGEVFQREMINQFGEIPGVEIVMDDILVHGADLEEHNKRLTKVLQKAREINLKLNEKKCKFAQTEVTYVGHQLTGQGLKPTEERIRAIAGIREPEGVPELETILGMITYVGKFIPNLSDITAPLRKLKTSQEWKWEVEHAEALQKVKDILVTRPLLRYYQVNKPVTLTVDASMKGLGAALIQDDGVVAYASRALTQTEERYAQIEKEALAVVFACIKFHKLIYGQENVVVESDHKPLENIFRKPIHTAPMRIQRMLLKLQPYDLKLVHIPGKSIGLADCLSRMPAEPGDHLMDEELMVCVADTGARHWEDRLRKATEEDENFQELVRTIIHGWPNSRCNIHGAVTPYWDVRDELSTYGGIIFRGNRVCIPASLRSEVLNLLHVSHSGMVKTKQLAREKIYWPGINKAIEDMVSKCDVCLKYRNKQPKEPMTIHPLPNRPWSKVGTDLLELDGTKYLVMVDYFSNYIELNNLEGDTTSENVIRHIKQNIARHGIMDILVSDNGPQYSSSKFVEFTQKYRIQHLTSSPLYPQSNGLAEKAVQTVKKVLMKCRETGEDIYLALLDLRNTPRDGEIGSPMQRLMGRRAQTLLPAAEAMLHPTPVTDRVVQDRLLQYRLTQKGYYDRGSRKLPQIGPQDAVRIHTPRGWDPAEYTRKHQQPNSHVVKAGDQAREYRRNRRDLLVTKEPQHRINPNPPAYIPAPPPVARRNPPVANHQQVQAPPNPVVPANLPVGNNANNNQAPSPSRNMPVTRYGRQTKPPVWMKNMVP